MLPCDSKLRWRLIETAQQKRSPDLLVRGGRVWNAFTDEVTVADVAVCGDRIARVGRWDGPLDSTEVVDAAGGVVVPGYIEPHTHPWPFVNPLSLGEAAVERGTTALLYDDLFLHLALGPERLARFTRAVSGAAVPHVFWAARMASQSRFEGEQEVFSLEVVTGLLRQPQFVATAEMTRWVDLLDPNHGPRLLEIIENARALGAFADGHTAGASVRRLPALAAAGLRSCHEAITAEEALERLRRGLWVLLRNSSLRQDLTALLPVLSKTGFSDRFCLTTDGAKAHHVRAHGLTDHLIGMVLEAGVRPGVAYRMATLNPALYLGLDEDLGAVAPGRAADLNLLTDLGNPAPELTVCRGRVAARGGRLVEPAPSGRFDWEGHFQGAEARIPRWGPERFPLPRGVPDPFPGGRLANAVITREEPVPLRAEGPGVWPASEEAHLLTLTDRTCGWITRGVVLGFAPGLAALATTYTTNGGTLVLGTGPAAMAEATACLGRIGGGMVVIPEGGQPRTFRLPLAGIHRGGGFGAAAEEAGRLQQTLAQCGYNHADPNYSLLFFSCDFLPELRATQAGWIRIKTGETLVEAERLD